MTAEFVPLTDDQVRHAELLRDIMTAVQTVVIARYYKVEKADLDEARRIMDQVPKLRAIWLRAPIRNDEHMAEQIAHWGSVLRACNAGQEAPLWEAVNRL